VSAFRYPKFLHVRTQKPPQYKQYSTYKRVLQKEFARTCVYCRAVDTVAPGVVFGVDHYRPKSKYPAESTNYLNLYYCCSACNSRKNNHWPFPEFADTQMIPNPCDHVMTRHLRFKESSVEPKTESGEFALELLDLNDPAAIAFRDHVNHMVDVLTRQETEARHTLDVIEKRHRRGELSTEVATDLHAELVEELRKIDDSLARYYGTLPVD